MTLSQNIIFDTNAISRFGIGCHKLNGGFEKNGRTILFVLL